MMLSRRLTNARRPRQIDRLLTDTSWTWFWGPRAVFDATSNKTFFGVSRSDGIYVGEVDHGNGDSVSTFRLQADTENDHNVAAIGIRPDGRIIAAYSNHNGAMRVRISTNARDISAFGGSTTLTLNNCTYPKLIYLSAESRWYLFYRFWTGSATGQTYVSTSDDNGATWSTPAGVHDRTGTAHDRPYCVFATNGVDRIDLLLTDGHPNDTGNTTNHVYHLYYDGTWRETGGTSLGAIPVPFSDLALVHDGDAAQAWIWDLAYDPTGAPVALIMTYASPSATATATYVHGRWNGSTWVTTPIVESGPTEFDAASYERSGVCFAPRNANQILVAREVGSATAIERWGTNDNGATWSKLRPDVSTAAGSLERWRPFRVDGGGPYEVMWHEGSIAHYTDHTGQLMALRR